MKPSLLDHWRISFFRLAIVFGLIFIVGNVALLSLVYWQTSSYLMHRIDDSILLMSDNFTNLTPEQAHRQINDALKYDLRKSNLYGLFDSSRTLIAGNIKTLPEGVTIDGHIHQFVHVGLPPYLPNLSVQTAGWARARFQVLSNGDILVVGRDFTQLAEIKEIIRNALIGSGISILLLGLLSGFLLSIRPLRRINVIRTTSGRIMQGELSLRLPVSNRHDELDMLALIVNLMLEEIERLLTEVKSVSDTLAHDLRTPLTRLRLILYRAQQQLPAEFQERQLLEQALTETDSLLERFRALLRISEIENRHRQSGFIHLQPDSVVLQVAELVEPLAEDAGVQLIVDCGPTSQIHADPDLLFEAISNLLDNAIKFTPRGGWVRLKLSQSDDMIRIDISDNGCGIPADEHDAVMLRFHRSNHDQNQKQGYGLGLSIVAAILRLHGFHLQFQPAEIGTHLTLLCPAIPR